MTLSEYLIEAVARRAGKYEYDFPVEPDKDRMIEFLESNGFKRVSDEFQEDFRGRVYWLGKCKPGNPETFWIKFTDTEKRPSAVFFYRFKNTGHYGWSDFMVNTASNTYEEFKDYVYDYFGL